MRRCIICHLPTTRHTREFLELADVLPHAFDPGERRETNPMPRDVVWSIRERQQFRANHGSAV